jgi:hypothetical protein
MTCDLYISDPNPSQSFPGCSQPSGYEQQKCLSIGCRSSLDDLWIMSGFEAMVPLCAMVQHGRT